MSAPQPDRDSLVLILAPVGRDAALLQKVLTQSRIDAAVCPDVSSLCESIGCGAGAVLVAEEALNHAGMAQLSAAMQSPEPWSDLPLLVLTARGAPSTQTRQRFVELERLGSLSLLERPLRPDTIVSAVRAALRARLKQYDVRRRDAELRLVNDNVPVLLSYIDRYQVFRRVNQTYTDWFGRPPEEIVGRSVREVGGEDHWNAARPYVLRALGGEAVHFESTVCDASGNLRDVAVSYSPDRGADGAVRGFVALVQDITARKRSESRQSLLLRLLEGQRHLEDPAAMMNAAADEIGRYLHAGRAGFFEVSAGKLQPLAGWSAGPLPLFSGTVSLQAAGVRSIVDICDAKPIAIENGDCGDRVCALIHSPIIREGVWQAGLYVHHAQPRSWREDEIELVQDVAAQTWDAVQRGRAESALRQREARFRFLTSLDDATRPLADPEEIANAAARLLSEHLQVDSVAYGHLAPDEKTLEVLAHYLRNPAAPAIRGRYQLGMLGPALVETLRSNRPWIVVDTGNDPRTAPHAAAYAEIGIRANAAVPIHRNGRLSGALGVHSLEPKEWTADEIELIRLVANRCWESIERARVSRELAEREQRYRFLAESIPQMVWTATPDGRVDYLNRRTQLHLGVDPQTLLDAGPFAAVHPEDRESAQQRWAESVATGQPYESLFRLRRASDGAWRWHLVRAMPMTGDDGTVLQWFGSATDIQDQKATEEELKRINRELEQFAYVSSHDLQEPLRTVNTSSQLLLRKIGPQADPELCQFANNISTGVERMEALIRDLLSYSRVGHSNVDTAAERADLNAAFGDAMERLDERVRETHAEVIADPLPVVVGDQGQLAHVFQNLLSNAMKYRKPDVPPCIHIGAERANGNWTVHVADNGIGFEEIYAERIFGLFKRLHRQDEYPGTGLGLAICKRIIERHGGRIWAESRAGQGATFYVSLPDQTPRSVGLPACL